MTFRNRFLFIAFSIVCLIGLVHQWITHNKTIDDYDAPKILSGKKEMISLRHIQRSCECADWIPANLYKDSVNLREEDYLFIEAATEDLDVPASYWALADSGYVLRLHGEFYKGKAIPYNYIQRTDHKPALAKVFYYTSREVVKPQ